MERRLFFKLGLAQAVAVSAPIKINAMPEKSKLRTTPSVLQGASDESRTQFSVVYNRQVPLDFLAVDRRGRMYKPDRTDIFTQGAHPLAITKTFFSSLSSKDDYYLHILSREDGKLIETREFKTLASITDQTRFALCSCMDDRFHEPEIWRDIIKQSPNIIFFIGDSVYADRNEPNGIADADHLWKRFSEVRMTLEIYFSRKLIPIVATWDDHDFGKNDPGSNYSFVRESQQNVLRTGEKNKNAGCSSKSNPTMALLI